MTPRELWDREPVALSDAVKALLHNGLTLAVLFGARLTPEQVVGVLVFANSALGLLGLIVRNKVAPWKPEPVEVPLTKETIQ